MVRFSLGTYRARDSCSTSTILVSAPTKIVRSEDMNKTNATASGAETVIVPTLAEAITEILTNATGADTATVGREALADPGVIACASGAVTVTVPTSANAFAFAA